MGRKNRKQKQAARQKEKQTQVASKPDVSLKPAESTKPAAFLKPEEVVAAIVQAVAPPLFESPAEAQIEAQIEAALESTPALLEPGPDSGTHATRDADLPPPYADHRSFPRIALAVQIGLESDSHFFSGLSGDVSEGGVFVQTYRELPLGSEVEIDFDLPTGRVSTHGTVRWHRSPSESAPPGVGIAFQNLAGEARSLIHDFCEARAPLYYDVEHA